MATASGSIKLPHTCPKCGKFTATNYQELETYFGFRNMKNSKDSKVRNQSWCRECRKKYS